MIVEVKASSEIFTNEVREQGISYARLLRKGGIAPFVSNLLLPRIQEFYSQNQLLVVSN